MGMACGSIDPRETDLMSVRGNDALLAYPDAMRIAAQVFDHLLGASEGRFGIDYEGLLGCLAQRSTQGRFITLKFTFADGCFQVTEGACRETRRTIA